jgi:FAD/FMN-containing dehydrogenase
MTHAAMLSGGQAAISDEAVEALQTQLRGPAIGAEARAAFNAMHQGSPAITAVCSGTADVIDAVRFAQERGLAIAVRGGGHSIAGLSSTDGGMLIDLSPMRGVDVDPATRVAHVQGGALWGDVDREAQAFGLVAPGGVVSDTGVAGLTLGGGYGWVRRRYGLSCDNLLAAQIVCADGELRKASADENPDLYWALRGGGGNFGVVTSFTFALNPLGPIVAFSGTFYPVEELPSIMPRWREYVEQAPDEVTSTIVTITFPADPAMPEAIHDRPCAIVGAVYAGDPDDGMKVLEPLRSFGTVLADLSQPMPFTAVQAAFDPLFPRNEIRAYWKSTYLDELSDDAMAVIADRAADRPAPLTLVNTFHMGGAIAAVDPEATAFAERGSKYMISIDGMWSDEADDAANIAWVRDAYERVSPYGNGAVYLNFTGRADEAAGAGTDSAFGRNLRRLAEVKATYDPENFFRLNNNISPA